MNTPLFAGVVAAVMIVGSGAALAVEKKAPEPGTQEYQLALETGALPASELAKLHGQSGAESLVPTVKIGELVYRLGIDTH